MPDDKDTLETAMEGVPDAFLLCCFFTKSSGTLSLAGITMPFSKPVFCPIKKMHIPSIQKEIYSPSVYKSVISINSQNSKAPLESMTEYILIRI